MENPSLKLHIAKGPRKGEELEFKAGSRIRIGRVVRGNNVTIKDAGISSNHLSIEFDPRSGTWILQDLGSSNGTFINASSEFLSPNTAYNLSDGDSIKIGETTSILVSLVSCVVDLSELPQNPRRRGKPAAGRKKLKEGEGATGIFKESEGLKEADEIVKDAGTLKEADEIVKDAGTLKEADEIVKDAGTMKEADEIVKGAGTLKEADEIVKDAGTLKEADGIVKDAGTLKEADEIVKDSRVDLTSAPMKEVENININPEKERIAQAPRVSPRKTRSRMKKVDDGIGNNNCEEKNILGNKRTRASSRRKNQNEDKDVNKLKTVLVAAAAGNVNAVVSNLEEEEEEEETQMCNDKHTEPKEEDLGGREKGKESAAANGEGTPLDLEKITVRELFDYLEVYLRKQIYDETDKALEALREKAERTKEYVREQRKKMMNSDVQSAA